MISMMVFVVGRCMVISLLQHLLIETRRTATVFRGEASGFISVHASEIMSMWRELVMVTVMVRIVKRFRVFGKSK